MYFPAWIGLVAVSLWVSLLAFLWGLRSGQFSDQERARYLPLADELPPAPAVKGPSGLTKEAYALLGIVGLGVLGMLSALALSLFRWKG